MEIEVKQEEVLEENDNQIEFVSEVKVHKNKKNCAVPGCKKRADINTSLHSFPSSNLSMQRKWLRACKLLRYNQHLKICSDHFNREDFKVFEGKRFLIFSLVVKLLYVLTITIFYF